MQNVKLSSKFLIFLSQNISQNYMNLAVNDECSLFDLLNTDLVNFGNMPKKMILFNYEDINGERRDFALELNQFMNQIAYKKCPNSKKLSKYFKRENLRKTLQTLKLDAPNSIESCISSMNEFSKNLTTPYLCNIIEEIKVIKEYKRKMSILPSGNFEEKSNIQLKIDKAVSYSKILNAKAKDLLAGRCNNLENKKKYCERFFKKGVWSSLIYDNQSFYNYFCQNLSKKECLKSLNNNDHHCLYEGITTKALFPQPSCSELSIALSHGRYKSKFNDCPGLSSNDALTGFSRLLAYFEDPKIPENQNCDISSTFPFIKFTEQNTEFNDWDVQTCYKDPLRGNNEFCQPTFFGDIEGFKPSITRVMAEIAGKLKGFQGQKCKMIPKSKYKPTFLEYKAGCFILTPEEGCHGSTCELSVILDQVEFKNYEFKGKLNFNLFPVDFINENKSLIKVFETSKNKKIKTIKNMSSFLLEFEQHKNGIFFGMGCAEQLLPRFFTMKTLNQCTPTTFIIDGFIKDQGMYALTTKTSFDQDNIARIIPWRNISASIKAFKNKSPIKLWGFYAIH